MSTGLETLFDDGVLRHPSQAAALFQAGDPVSAMFLVVSGMVAVTRQTPAGTALVLYRAGAG